MELTGFCGTVDLNQVRGVLSVNLAGIQNIREMLAAGG